MLYRLLSLALITASMSLIVHTELLGPSGLASPLLVLGFLLLAAYETGLFFAQLGLPRITGYIVAGLFLGPYFFNFYSTEAITEFSFLNSLALAFIAFCAGGELKLANIVHILKSIVFLVVVLTLVVFSGITLTVFALSNFIPFMDTLDPKMRFAIAAIFGVIAVASSPSSTIAIISETKAKGIYTDMVLSVTIVRDVVIIILFAVVVSFCQVMLSETTAVSPSFILSLLFEIVIALGSGFFLGKGIVFLIEAVHVEFPIVITAMGFVVIKFCHQLGTYFNEVHAITVNIEPLLICMSAGFTVQNFSRHGKTFLDRMDRVSFPIYVAFFALAGASINVEVVRANWLLGVVIVLARIVMIYIGSLLSGKLSGEKPTIYKNTWLGFITQAGVSLGLLTEVVRRFTSVGISIQSILIASITLNQLIGPIAFKTGLKNAGEIPAVKK